MRETHGPAFAYRGGVDVEHVLAMMDGLRMVDPVHPQRLAAVVDGMVDVTAKGHLDAGRSATASREIVDD